MWSPDGRYIYANDRIYDLNADNIGQGLPIQTFYSNPAWSPDSRHLAVNDGLNVYIINVDGSPLTKLPIPPDLAHPSSFIWQPLPASHAR